MFHKCGSVGGLSGFYEAANFFELIIFQRDGDLGSRHPNYHTMLASGGDRTFRSQWRRHRDHTPCTIIDQAVKMANIDWSQCPAVESVPDRRSGAWVFRDTRMPVATVFENLEQYDVTREQIQAVLEFAARSLDAPPVPAGVSGKADAHPV